MSAYDRTVATDVQAIWQHLGVEPDESVVLSAIYLTETDPPGLMAASLLVGPAGIAEGWPAWRVGEGFRPRPSDDALRVPGEFTVEAEGIVAGRAVMDPKDANRWISSVLEDGICPAVGHLPEAQASLRPARAPIRVCTHSESEAGDLAAWLARPIVGFHFPSAGERPDLAPANHWTIGDTQLFGPALDLLGMSWFEDKKGSAPSGLMLGRFERRAWLASQKLEPESDLYRVEVGLEPDRTELMDLELEVEEEVDGELVFAEHLRLEDTALEEVESVLYGPPSSEGRLEIGVALPTLGRGVRRSVRLTHRDGALLDSWRSFNIVESISVNLTVNGAEQPAIKIGEERDRQDLVELLGAVERVQKQYSDIRRGGARNRLFDDPAQAARVLRALLERAPGELLVVDAYFRDWSLLLGLTGPPPRVLIGPRVDPPPPAFEGKVRRWSGEVVPFHDRFYLWDGGGVSVGTSAGSKTNRLFRIVRIGAAEAEVLRDQFALWWVDPDFEQI
jgi:hypothetical protein